MSSLAKKITTILKKLFPEPVVLHEPIFKGNEWDYVKQCLDTGWVSSAGKFVDRFERQLEEFTNSRHVIAVVNGTAALQICLQLTEVQQNDEVLIPTLTFVATANTVKYCGAIPHFVDSDEKSLGVDPEKLEDYLKEIAEIRSDICINKKTGRPIRAMVVVHTFGHPVDLDPLVELCNRYKLKLIEDAAESLGSYYKECHTGNRGVLSALSFNGNKVITTGGGGAILTQDKNLAEQAKHLTTTAKVPHKWAFMHDCVAYNYRLPNINAALGCAQLEQLPDFLTRKRLLAEKYNRVFCGVEGVVCFNEPNYARSNYWMNVLLFDRECVDDLEIVLKQTNDQDIMTRPAWNLMHTLPMFSNSPRMNLSMAESLRQRVINLPSSPALFREPNQKPSRADDGERNG
jgi:perosamine synthetase